LSSQKTHSDLRAAWSRLDVLAVLVMAAGCACGQDTMILSSGSAASGTTVSLDLTLSVAPGSAPASVEWTYSYSAGDFTGVSVAAGPAALAAGKSVSCNGTPGSYRCLLFGINSTALRNGVVATATFTVSPTTPSTSSTVQVINSGGAMGSGIPVAITATSGLVLINPVYAATGLVCSPATVTTPGSATCTVTVSAPAPTGGLTVNTGIASTASVAIPSSVVIAAGSAAGEFAASILAVNASTTAVVSASLNGTRNFTLTLLPNPSSFLAADWKLSEPSGATAFADASGNGNSGACGSACPTLGAAGKVGTAASFNGTSSQIIVPDSPSLRLNQFTVALWVFPTQQKSDYQLLVAKEDSSAANRNYGLYIVPNSLRVRYSVWAGDCATKLAANSSGQMALNAWNYIVFTYDGATAALYLNGVLDSASPALAGTLCQAAVPVKIGMETSVFLPFSGTLDDIQIYSQAWTAAQVASLYNPPAADWKLDEPSGAITFADAANGNSGACGSACPTLGAAGEVGTAASFNGTSSQIIVPDSPSLRLNQFTVALWVFPTQQKSDYQLLVAKEDSSAANRNYGLYIAPNSLQVRYSVWAGDCATKLAANSSGQMTLNTWNYIVFTYDGATAALYLNGVLDSSTPALAGALCQAAVPVKIGMETSSFLPFSGTLDEIQIYPQAWTAVRVASQFSPPAAKWKLDDPSGATAFADASGDGNSGACGSACPTLGAAGKVGTAASFNGTSSQIVVPDSPSLRLNQFTIALWVFPTQEKSDYQLLVAKEDSSAANRNYGLYIVPNSLRVRYSFWAGDCTTKLAANTSSQMALNAWNYIVFTYDGATAALYLNGVLDSATPALAGTLCQAAVPVKIGMETSVFLPFSGSLDDIQIYAQAWTAAQVAGLYNPRAADWKLDEPSGATAFADASGNGNSGACGSACPTLGAAGEVGTAASFNDTSQIVVPDSPSLRLNQFTIALWVFPTQEKSDYQLLVAKEDSSAANRNYGLYIVPNSLRVRYSVWAGDCTTKLAANSSSQMALNAWNYVVFTYDGATAELYLNGVLDSVSPISLGTLCQAAVPVKIGRETSVFLPFSGTLDDIQIYSKALTTAEAEMLFFGP